MSIDTALLTLSATGLAASIRERRVSAAEVVDAHIAAVEAFNPRLNAVVSTRFDEARREARAADELAASTPADELPPLHGVPFTVKESIWLTGMPNTSGLVSRRDHRAASDATAVARWRAAGAIPLGVTNVSELCMWMESNNAVWGRSNNPYDATRIVGGSSGGEGSIIGSGASPFGIGADVGGSIRMPAFFNGVFGHKPTPGIIPNTGQYPHAEGEAGRYLCTGPLCRRAEDLTPLIRLAAGPDQVDPFTRPFSLPDPDLSLLRGMRVILITTNHLRRPSDPLVASMRRAADVLAAEGADVREVSLKSLRASFSLWSGLMSAASETSFASHMGGGPEVSPWVELARLFVGRSNHTLPAIILAIAEGLPGIDTADAAPLKQRAAEVRAELLEQMGPGGVILYPPYTRTAPRHREPLLTPLDFLYTALWNVLEFPVTQVPLGLDERGLPLGVQVVGAPYEDHRTITVALALEQALGGWVPPWVAASGSGRPRTVLQLAH